MTISEDKDWLLEKLVIEVNGTDLELPITVLIDGMLISGKLISAHKFLDKVHDKFIIKGEVKDVDNINNEILGRRIESKSKRIVEVKDSIHESPSYFHISNAVIRNKPGNKAAVETASIWRGVIDKVSGFHIDL